MSPPPQEQSELEGQYAQFGSECQFGLLSPAFVIQAAYGPAQQVGRLRRSGQGRRTQ